MANEQNYTIVLLQNNNQALEQFACPKCHNDDMDTLEIDENDEVKCLDCGNEFIINA
ncbi:hypothetical protein M0R04_08295 [Candidatus Dojkabacteria bacterium]|jgi:ribosomal protein S27E|nr:hypothetical protein [Candidatus Dojkabacteria bacterium]